MPDGDPLTRAFDEQRPRLVALAGRMLGSVADGEDAVQETWLRVARTPRPDDVESPVGWIRTVLTRICLDALRARRARREEPGADDVEERARHDVVAADPAEQAELADAVGRALLAVLDTLEPAERIAFVLHDMFAVPHVEIAGIVDRSAATTKKLASRARRKIRGSSSLPAGDRAAHRDTVERFLRAARSGDLDAVVAVLAPDVVRRADAAALPPGVAPELRGAGPVAAGTVLLAARAASAELVLVDGAPGLVVTARGRVVIAVALTVGDGLVQAYDVVADPGRLAALVLALLPEDG